MAAASLLVGLTGAGDSLAASPDQSELGLLRQHITGTTQLTHLLATTDDRYSECYARGELRSSALRSKASAACGTVGLLFGLYTQRNIDRLVKTERAGQEAGSVAVAGALLGVGFGAVFHSVFGKLD